MINNITLAETLFSGIGISITILAFVFILIRKRRRFGILSLLLGNLFLWSVIVFPKKISDLMIEYGVPQEHLSSNELHKGLITGIFLFILWYSARTIFVGFAGAVFKPSKVDTENSEKEQPDNAFVQESSNAKDQSRLNEEKADPHLFDNLNSR